MVMVCQVNCLTTTDDDGSSGNQKVEVYKRTCEGRFVNDTTSEGGCFDTTQACRGLTTLTMRMEHKEPENTMWVTDMVFEKQCATRFVMDVTECEDPKGKKLGKTQVVTLCDGSAFTAIDNKVTSAPSALLEPAKPCKLSKHASRLGICVPVWQRTVKRRLSSAMANHRTGHVHVVDSLKHPKMMRWRDVRPSVMANGRPSA